MSDILNREIKYIPGIGPKKAEVLQKELEVFTLYDLLHYYPYRYVDRSKVFRVRDLHREMPYVQLKGRIFSFEVHGEGHRKRLVAHFSDGTGFVDLVWFKGISYIENKYKLNTDYIVFGKPSLFGNKFNIPHPEIDPFLDEPVNSVGLFSMYNTSEKMKNSYLNSKAMRKIVENALALIPESMEETLPYSLINDKGLMSINEALCQIHFPLDADKLRGAIRRLKFEELFYVQLNIVKYMSERKQKSNGYVFSSVGDYFNRFYNERLPFPLTSAQKKVIKEIRRDVLTGKQMNRLLQGDVGSGKTLVAMMSMLIAVGNGFQTCIMAPTEILANQHYETFSSLLGDIGINVALLTGSTKKKDRVVIHERLLSGDIHMLIGTHALIENEVVFKNLGLVVIDEQHRFGVAQRAKLWAKSVKVPHVLVMTATPIPRTLAMTLYGDLDVSIIDELPPGRKPVKTVHRYDKKRGELYLFLREQLGEGRQVYIVFPLIEESETLDLKDLESGYLQIKEIFPDFEVCKMHGKMKPAEKDEAMHRFLNKEVHIMVSTTVIEVGVNVPNASVMVIESAQRFGLSQLHQLRGRVGRGASQSYCVLITPYELSSETRKRMSIMVDSNDGFVIAEADLKLRGPGDLEGTQQSGLPFNLKIASLIKDGNILQEARDVAVEIVDRDPEFALPENAVLLRELKKRKVGRYGWGMIS